MISFGVKKSGPERCEVQKHVWTCMLFTNLESHLKRDWVKQNFGSKNDFWSTKNYLGNKNIWPNRTSHNTLGPSKIACEGWGLKGMVDNFIYEMTIILFSLFIW